MKNFEQKIQVKKIENFLGSPEKNFRSHLRAIQEKNVEKKLQIFAPAALKFGPSGASPEKIFSKKKFLPVARAKIFLH